MSIIYRIGIHFTLRAERTDKKGYAPIYMLLTYQGEKISGELTGVQTYKLNSIL